MTGTDPRVAGALLSLFMAAVAPGVALADVVEGRVTIEIEGARLEDVGPLVVFLTPTDDAPDSRVPRAIPQIHQRNATFSPSFLVITAGQTVEMPNDDVIFHNVFSYSKPNDFDLGVYPQGESRAYTFRHAGVVRIYCSIHESMNALIFVSPTRFHATVGPGGRFRIEDVPPGSYRARTWGMRLPESFAELEVRRGQTSRVDLRMAARGGGG